MAQTATAFVSPLFTPFTFAACKWFLKWTREHLLVHVLVLLYCVSEIKYFLDVDITWYLEVCQLCNASYIVRERDWKVWWIKTATFWSLHYETLRVLYFLLLRSYYCRPHAQRINCNFKCDALTADQMSRKKFWNFISFLFLQFPK